MFLFPILVLALAALFVWSNYNWFVTAKTRIKASVQEIGNQLKRQADLIPNLIESVKGYLKHEKEVFEDLTSARRGVMSALEKGQAGDLVKASENLEKAFAPIRAVFESNPQLQGAQTTGKLMDELRDTADKVMYSRRTLIDLTADYNAKRLVFPSNFVAQMFHFEEEAGLETPVAGTHLKVTEKETETPQVKLN